MYKVMRDVNPYIKDASLCERGWPGDDHQVPSHEGGTLTPHVMHDTVASTSLKGIDDALISRLGVCPVIGNCFRESDGPSYWYCFVIEATAWLI